MQNLLDHYADIYERVKKGSTRVNPKELPMFSFLLGFMYSKVHNFPQLFETLQSLYTNKLERYKINDLYFMQIFQILFKDPSKLRPIRDLMIEIDNKLDVNVLLQVQKLKDSLTKQSPNREMAPERTGSKGTVIMEQGQEQIFGMMDQENNSQQYYAQQQRQMRESQQLARRLQEEQQNLAKNSNNHDQAECQICYVGLYDDPFTLLQHCGHIFHKQCLLETFKANITSNIFPLKCPNDQCKAQVFEAQIKQVVPKELYEKYQQNTLKSYADVNGDTTSWCPTADCSYFFFYEKDDQPRFECVKCNKQYCLNCRVQWHKEMTCKQYQISNTTTQSDKQFLKFVKGKKFKQCPKCKLWVQRTTGCDHMTCKCKFQFCYKCGGIYLKCQCYLKMLEQQKINAERLQQQRRKNLQAKKKLKKKKEVPKTSPRPRRKPR